MNLVLYLFVYFISVKLFAILLRFLCRYDWFYGYSDNDFPDGPHGKRDRYKNINELIVVASIFWPMFTCLYILMNMLELFSNLFKFIAKILLKIT